MLAIELYTEEITARRKIDTVDMDEEHIKEQIKNAAREFAKLDGYDVMLRSTELKKHGAVLSESKCWSAPVRVYIRNDKWQSEDGAVKGSHDETGQVRPEYAATVAIYDKKGALKDELLNPDCIEGKGWNLSAGQYKPFVFATTKSEKSVVEMIGDLKRKEQKILEGLNTLLSMVEGRE
jgi:type I restriction enzyme M protein